mmetsp:Transcript_6877/g.12514  ORF Transcript_6877/g.12514 Transcript_6877/m.12514 type:complete len:353 (-) Transcript_6877:528-1586(-)
MARKVAEAYQGDAVVLEEHKHNDLTFRSDKVIGHGSFGVVYQAVIVETGETVAIKKVFQDRRYKNRELQIMKEMNHPNIISLKHEFYSSENAENVYLHLVMDYVPGTVYRVTKTYVKQREPVPPILVKLYGYQLFRSIGHLHSKRVCHRDIKPQNLLVTEEDHVLKLCDFGSAKYLMPGEENVSYICSRYYRAPELIFGTNDYTFSIDVWSAGCVIAELMTGQPLFQGESGVDQLVEIIKLLGTPSRAQVRAMNPNFSEFKFPFIKTKAWVKTFGASVSTEGMDLLHKVLVYTPGDRPSPYEAMAHPYFNELRSSSTRLPNGQKLPPLTDWTQEEKEAIPPHLLTALSQVKS